MSTRRHSLFDHSLVARTQACCTGAEAHDLHALLAAYCGLCELAEADEECVERVRSVEQRLRAHCRTSELRRFRERAEAEVMSGGWRADGCAEA